MASYIKRLELENVKLKVDNKELTKHSEQKKVDDQMSTPLKVCMLLDIVLPNCMCIGNVTVAG